MRVPHQPDPPDASAPEDADIETSSDAYARRFSGTVGRWFLDVQAATTLALLRHLPAGASVLDVGGGHAQLAPALLGAGFEVTVVGSDPSCAGRLAPWLEQDRCRFEVANLRALPFPTGAFEAVLCFRLLPHSVAWTDLVGELSRVARRSVVLDYPSQRSVNVVADRLFRFKQRVEGNTRRYRIFDPREVRSAFTRRGFEVMDERPQFLFPMVLHRGIGNATVSRLVEAPPRLLGLTRLLGSPVILRADRRVAPS